MTLSLKVFLFAKDLNRLCSNCKYKSISLGYCLIDTLVGEATRFILLKTRSQCTLVTCEATASSIIFIASGNASLSSPFLMTHDKSCMPGFPSLT